MNRPLESPCLRCEAIIEKHETTTGRRWVILEKDGQRLDIELLEDLPENCRKNLGRRCPILDFLG